jgi:hypothetical protein
MSQLLRAETHVNGHGLHKFLTEQKLWKVGSDTSVPLH